MTNERQNPWRNSLASAATLSHDIEARAEAWVFRETDDAPSEDDVTSLIKLLADVQREAFEQCARIVESIHDAIPGYDDGPSMARYACAKAARGIRDLMSAGPGYISKEDVAAHSCTTCERNAVRGPIPKPDWCQYCPMKRHAK